MNYSGDHRNCAAMRIMIQALLVLVMAALAGGLAQRAHAVGEEWPAGWLATAGWWEIYQDKLRTRATQTGAAHDRYGTGAIGLFGNSNWQDVRVSLRAVEGTDVYCLLVRAQNPGDCVQFGRYGRTLQLIRFKDGQIATDIKVDGGPITLPEVLTVEIRGNTIQGFANGQLKTQHTFASGEIADHGRVGLQTNHNWATLDQVTATTYTTINPGATSRQVTIESVSLSENYCGPQRLQVRVNDSLGAGDIMTVHCEDVVTTPAIGTALPLSPMPLQLVRRESSTVGVWEVPFYSLAEGTHKITVTAYDGGDRASTRTVSVNLSAKDGTFVTIGNKKIFENIDPHPVWRNLAAEVPQQGTQNFGNYLWQLEWDTGEIRCHALTIEPAQTGNSYVGRRIIQDNGWLAVHPYLLTLSGQTLSGTTTRRLGEVTNMLGIQPTYETETAYGKLTWWLKVENGSPILRLGGTFQASRDVTLSCNYAISNTYAAVKALKPASANWPAPAAITDNYILWRPADRTEGPVFSWAFNRKPTTSDMSRFGFARVSLRSGQTYDLPMLALAVVDANADYTKLDATQAWAAQLARAALSVPRLRAGFRDLSSDSSICHVALERGYDFLPNDWGLTDTGQMIALPWCAGTHVSAQSPLTTGFFHSAFGWRPYTITRESQVTLDLPMPNLTPEKLTPAYESLAGDWRRKAEACIDQLVAWQGTDGTFSGYDRMDHYSLARMTLGLMMAYPGLKDSPVSQAKVAAMVLKALDRMMGEKKYFLTGDTRLHKGYTGGAEELAWNAGDPYEPFVYSPKWNMFTEMGAQVDQNLGHAHLLLTLLLYGHYIDPEYLKKPAIAEKLRELIKFQWLSQDWNGDIWRVYAGGIDAAGAGDGFEEDLAMLLPRLAEMAGLEKPWHDLAARISAMKFGALKQFDYLPLNNEWGYEFLTPMHHPSEWTPESGWGRAYVGDVWWTGPATCAGIYGPWYAENIYKPIPDIFHRMWYELLEDPRDTIREDARHWLTIGGYCSEAQLGDPFLGAVKLMRAYDIAKQLGYLNVSTRGEWIWNFAFHPAAMTVIQHELLARYPFMKDGEPVAAGVSSPDVNHVPAYGWKLKGGEAVVSVAAYRIQAPTNTLLQINGSVLGLSGQKWIVTDLKTGATSKLAAGQKLPLTVAPHSSTTVRIAPDLPKSSVRDWGRRWE